MSQKSSLPQAAKSVSRLLTADTMGVVIQACREIGRATNAAVILVHHSPKGGDTPRGHSILDGAADVTLRIETQPNGTRVAHMGKNRNGPSDGKLAFEIEAIDLGKDEDGDPVTAPVAKEVSVDDTKGRPKLSGAQSRAHKALLNAIVSDGQLTPSVSGFPTSSVRGVRRERWFAECERSAVSNSASAANRDRTFRDIQTVLLDKGLIAVRDDWIWPARRPEIGTEQIGPDQSGTVH